MQNAHYRRLEHMFLCAPINQLFNGVHMELAPGSCVIRWQVTGNFFHAGKSLHGAIYTKFLDDAAYFSAATLNDRHFIVTKSLHVRFLRPVAEGLLTATGKSETGADGSLRTTAVLHVSETILVATAEARFTNSKLLLADVDDYANGEIG